MLEDVSLLDSLSPFWQGVISSIFASTIIFVCVYFSKFHLSKFSNIKKNSSYAISIAVSGSLSDVPEVTTQSKIVGVIFALRYLVVGFLLLLVSEMCELVFIGPYFVPVYMQFLALVMNIGIKLFSLVYFFFGYRLLTHPSIEDIPQLRTEMSEARKRLDLK